MKTLIVGVLTAVILPAQDSKPVPLLRGMGLHRHPIRTASDEAGRYFDQGLVLLYGFNRPAARRSFERAAALDPKAAMPHWGIAATYAPHINMDLDGDVNLKAACAAAGEASKRAAAGPEKLYANAAAALCQGEEGWRAAMRVLHQAYPDDLDAAALYAETLMVPVRWRWFTRDGKPAGAMAECIALLESVMRRDPDHPGANHFYVHAVEMSPTPERGLPAAQRLMGGIAPNAGHLVHMAGHIYFRVGDYEVVASSNERAISADEDHFQHAGSTAEYLGYYAHNLHFLIAARVMQMRYADAIAAANKLIERLAPLLREAPAIVDPIIATPLLVEERFARWPRILSSPDPAENLPVTRALWRFARTAAWLGSGDRARAASERALFDQARRAVAPGAGFLNNKAADILAIAGHVLDARLATAGADRVAALRRAIEVQDGLVYDEPPPWPTPIREELGLTLLSLGRAADAEAVLREDLSRTPRNPRSLDGLLRALRAQGKTDAARMVAMERERAWRRAAP
ncbi:MAG: hypothetical protein FJW40_01430 [Acidobacteria bacterium]|nr:hypothetical protein [Acidobacteriota bacterium]